MANEGEYKWLTLKNRTDGEARDGVIENGTYDAETEKIFDRGTAVFKEEMRGDTERAVGERRHECPDAPTARDRVEERDAEKTEEEAP